MVNFADDQLRQSSLSPLINFADGHRWSTSLMASFTSGQFRRWSLSAMISFTNGQTPMVSFADGQFYQLSVSPIVNFTDSFADAGETSNLMCGRMFEKVSPMVKNCRRCRGNFQITESLNFAG